MLAAAFLTTSTGKPTMPAAVPGSQILDADQGQLRARNVACASIHCTIQYTQQDMKLPVAPVDMRYTNVPRTLLLTTFQRNDFVGFAVIVLRSRRVGIK